MKTEPAALAQAPARASDNVDDATAARIVALGNGHAVVPPAAPTGRDEESATVARIAAIANGADLPSTPSQDTSEEATAVARIAAIANGADRATHAKAVSA